MTAVAYSIPACSAVTAALGTYAQPAASAVTAQFASSHLWQQVKTAGVDGHDVPPPTAFLNSRFLFAHGASAPSVHPQPAARWVTARLPDYAAPAGNAITATSVYQCAPTVSSFTAPSTQPIQVEGFASDGFGDSAIGNQIEWVHPLGVALTELGDVATRNQYEYVSPAPIAPHTPLPGNYRPIYSARTVTAQMPPHSMRLHKDVTAQILPPAVPRVENRNGTLKPRSFYAGEGGDPTVWNRNRFVWAGNLASSLGWGVPVAFNRDQYVVPAGLSVSAFGEAFAQGGVREVVVPQVLPPEIDGIPWVSFSPRKIEPNAVYLEFRSTHQVGGTRWIAAEGYDAARWGERVIPEIQAVFPIGAVGAFGSTKAWNYNTLVFAIGVRSYPQESDHWGITWIYNSRKYVAQFPDPESGLSGERWSLWTRIENRNRAIATHSTAPMGPSRPFIWNKAAQVLPMDIKPPATPPAYMAGQVAYRIRSLPSEGIDPPYITSWSRVFNKARPLFPAGLSASAYGWAQIESNRRRLHYITAGAMGIVEAPMIADAIRTITFEQRYAIQPPSIAMPLTRLKLWFVQPPGYNQADGTQGQVGGHFLHIHWNRFYPRWIHYDLFGVAALRNLTPEVRTHGRNAEEFGDTLVRLQWRSVIQQYPSTEMWGRAKISDRRLYILLAGANFMRLGTRISVTRVGGLPNYTQYLYPESYAMDLVSQVPRPWLQQQVLYVSELYEQASYGIPVVTANSIRVEPGLQELTVGTPAIHQYVRYLVVRAWESPTHEPIGKPRLSPHTIWSTMEAPEQAKRNHPTPYSLHYVSTGAKLGKPALEHWVRYIHASWRRANQSQEPSAYGHPHLANRRRVIEPPGIGAYRNGWQSVWGGIDYIQHEGAVDAFSPGRPSVSHVERWVRSVYPAGFAGISGAGAVMHFNRGVHPAGFVSLAMGSSRSPDNDYKRQTLYVGPPKPTIANGFDAVQFGETWASNRIRDVFVLGTDCFMSTYDLRHFKQRMRVWRRVRRGPARSIGAASCVAYACGSPCVALGTRYIRPDGNSEQFRKGGF